MNCDTDIKVGHIYIFIDSYNEKCLVFWKYTSKYSEDYKEKLKTDMRTTFYDKFGLKTTPSSSSLFIIEKFAYQDKTFLNSRVLQWKNKLFNHDYKLEKELPDIPQYLIEVANDYREHSNENKQKTIPVTNIVSEAPKHNPLLSNLHSEKVKKTNVEKPSITKTSTIPFKASIYTIYNPQEHKYYIGSTTETIQRRFEKHRCLPVPKMKHLKDKFNKLELKLIEEDVYNNPDDLELREDYYMVVYDCVDNGYNSRYNKCHSTCTAKLQEYKKKLQRKHGLKYDSDDDIDYKEMYKCLQEEHNKLKDKYDKLLINYNKLAPK